MARPRDKERAGTRGIIPFPEFDDAPPGPVPGPGAPTMIKGDAGERGTGGREGGGGGRGWTRHRAQRCRESFDFKFPISRRVGLCVENVACNVTTHTRDREKEQKSGRGTGTGARRQWAVGGRVAGRERENCIHSRHKTGREENDGGTRRRWQGVAMVEEEAAVAAAPRRNTPSATPLSPSIFSMIFERSRARSHVCVYIYVYVLR